MTDPHSGHLGAKVSHESIRKRIYLAHWFDGHIFRVAGAFSTRSAAMKRVNQLSGGTVQMVHLNEAVRFTHEKGKP